MSRIRLKQNNSYYRYRFPTITNRYAGVTTFEGYWWKEGKWVDRDSIEDLRGYSNHAPIFTQKKFRKMLVSAPKGVKFILASRYIDSDCYGVGRGINNRSK